MRNCFNPFQGVFASAAGAITERVTRMFQSLPGSLRFCGLGAYLAWSSIDDAVSIPSRESALLRRGWPYCGQSMQFQSLPGSLRFCGPAPLAAAAIEQFQSLPGSLRFCGCQLSISAALPGQFQSLPGTLPFCGPQGATRWQKREVSIPSRESSLLRRQVSPMCAGPMVVSIPSRESSLLRQGGDTSSSVKSGFNPFQGVFASAARYYAVPSYCFSFQSLPGSLRFCGLPPGDRKVAMVMFQSLPGSLPFCGGSADAVEH